MILPQPPDRQQPSVQTDKLLQKSKEMEVAFLAEMLAHAKVGDSPEGFGGGIGEEQFASFLRQEQARLLVDRGGIGLAQTIFDALVTSQEAQNG